MVHEFSRTEMIIGKENLEILKNAKVAIFGIGGVGTFVAEGLIRAGIGNFVLIDHDEICLTNLNRQIHATTKTIGRPKVEVMKERMLEINPKASIMTIREFYLPENSHQMIADDYDYIVDAIDTVTAKIDLVMKANERNIPIISSMGTGNKLNPTELEVTDIYKTDVCPLAKVMRKELKDRRVKKLKVVYSKENPIKPIQEAENDCSPDGIEKTTKRRGIPGSISFVPSVAGMIIASEVVKDLIKR